MQDIIDKLNEAHDAIRALGPLHPLESSAAIGAKQAALDLAEAARLKAIEAAKKSE